MNTINQSGWRPTTPEAGAGSSATFTGNRALMLEEPLIFEIGSAETTGVEIAAPATAASRLGGLDRSAPIGLPGLSERRGIDDIHPVTESRGLFGGSPHRVPPTGDDGRAGPAKAGIAGLWRLFDRCREVGVGE